MFLQLVTPTGPGVTAIQAADSLFLCTPLQISALVETVWRNRYNAASSPFAPWPQWITDAILAPNAPGSPNPNFISGYTFPPDPAPGAGNPQWPGPLPSGGAFLPPNQLPGVALDAAGNVRPTNWDHLIYAYLIENTRVFDVFAKVIETYAFSEQLETPSPASQLYWRNTEYLLFGDGLPSMLWNPGSRIHRDEIANRSTAYNWMFGIDLSHAAQLAAAHPYTKPAASNRDFIVMIESLLGEVWNGIMNAKNFSGANPTDPVAVAATARRIYDMMATRRLNGNLSREEFRAVAVMSWLHLTLMYDSPPVVDLKATASSPEQRLYKIAERVGMTAHSKAKPLFDLAQPFSYLMQSIESGAHNDPAGAALLYTPPSVAEANAEVVLDQYTLATGRSLKATAVSVTSRAQTPPPPGATRLPAAATRSPAGAARPPAGAARGDGRGEPQNALTR